MEIRDAIRLGHTRIRARADDKALTEAANYD